MSNDKAKEPMQIFDKPTEVDLSPFELAQAQLDMAAEKLNLDPNIHERLRYPRRSLVVNKECV